MLSALQAGRMSRHGSSRRQLPSLTFLLTQQSTISSIAGWVLGFVSTARDIVSIFKDCREMSQDANSKSESKKSSNEPDGRRPLTDCQLFGVFVFFVLSLISATYIGSWLGEFTVQVNIIIVLTDLNVYKPSLPVQVAGPCKIYRYLAASAQSGAAQVPNNWMSVPVLLNLSS